MLPAKIPKSSGAYLSKAALSRLAKDPGARVSVSLACLIKDIPLALPIFSRSTTWLSDAPSPGMAQAGSWAMPCGHRYAIAAGRQTERLREKSIVWKPTAVEHLLYAFSRAEPEILLSIGSRDKPAITEGIAKADALQYPQKHFNISCSYLQKAAMLSSIRDRRSCIFASFTRSASTTWAGALATKFSLDSLPLTALKSF